MISDELDRDAGRWFAVSKGISTAKNSAKRFKST